MVSNSTAQAERQLLIFRLGSIGDTRSSRRRAFMRSLGAFQIICKVFADEFDASSGVRRRRRQCLLEPA